MRNYGLVALLLMVLCPPLRAQHGGVSAGRLRAAYEALAEEGGSTQQRLFFEAFPTNGEDYELIFGFHPELRDSSLYDCASDMVEAFWRLDAIPDSLFHSKVAAVTCGLRCDADAPNYWWACLERVLTRHGRDAEALIDRVADLPAGDRMRFWSFVWSTIHDYEEQNRRDFHRGYILERHPQMVPIYDLAHELFFNGVNFSEYSPRKLSCPDSFAEARFFNAFPERGEDLTLLYEPHELTAGTTLNLSDSAASHISSFWNLRLIPAEVVAEKAVRITCGLRLCQGASCQWQWHLRQALARPDWRDVFVDEVARLRSGHQLEFWAMVWSSAEADSRDLLYESLQPILLTRHPHTASISERAFHLFHNGVGSRTLPDNRKL